MRIRQLREMNQAMVAIVGTLIIAAVVGFAVSFGSLPFIAQVSTYHAQFADAAGLAFGDEVRLAGINVGQVSAVELEGTHVAVTFTVKNYVHLGRATTLNVKIASVLGQEYLEVDPAGSGQLTASDVIPESQTTEPYTLLELLGTLSTETGQVNLPQLDTALKALSDDLRNTPPSTRAVLQGLGSLSQTLAGRQQQLAGLVTAAQQVTGTLASRQGELVTLLGNADLVLQTIVERRQVIHQLLVDSSSLGQQLTSLIQADNAKIAPLLANLQSVTGLLAHDQGALDQSIQLLAPFARYFANAAGSGDFADVTAPPLLLPDNAIVECSKPGATNASTGCTP